MRPLMSIIAWAASLPGGAATLAEGRWETFAVDGRDVDAHVPACASATSPVILSLHAWATNKNLQKGIDLFKDRTGPECAVVLYPQGKARGFLFGAVGYAWNAGGCCANANNDHVDDVSFLKNVITQAADKFPVSKEAVFVVGVSNGGMMANRLACADARVKAIVAVSGPLINGTGNKLTEVFGCPRSLPVLHFHGLADPVVPFSGCNTTVGGRDCEILEKLGAGKFAPMPSVADYIAGWRARNGVPQEQGAVTFKNGTATCTSWGAGASNVTLCTLQDEGHAWPGHCDWMNKVGGAMFRCTMDIDASQTALSFFRRYLPTAAVVV